VLIPTGPPYNPEGGVMELSPATKNGFMAFFIMCSLAFLFYVLGMPIDILFLN
jgi:hypothetical protein